MSFVDKVYGEIIEEIRKDGSHSIDRTGTGTTRASGFCVTYDISGGKVPVLGSKSVNLAAVIKELVWFVKGETNINSLGCNIWNEWADENGDLGPIYGKQWRKWTDTKIVSHEVYELRREELIELGYKVALFDDDEVAITREIDQLQRAIDQLVTNPDSRRIIVSAWNVGDLEDMALMPCHSFFQFISEEMSLVERVRLVPSYGDKSIRVDNVTVGTGDDSTGHALMDQIGVPKRKLTCVMYQRSADMFLGVPFNIASYSLLTHVIAHLTGQASANFIHVTGDTHVYDNHTEQLDRQLDIIKNGCKDIPGYVAFKIDHALSDLDGISVDSFKQVTPYIHHPAIKAQVAV